MENILKNKNLKITKNRLQVLNYINAKKYVSLKEMVNNLDIDKSTIYRIVDIYCENNILESLILDEERKYFLTNKHLHILKCIKCHQELEITSCPIEKNNYNDFLIMKHFLIIEGICKKCQKK